MDWYFKVIQHYAVFKGRARRKEYWMFFLFNIIFAIVVGVVSAILANIIGADLSYIPSLYALTIFLPSIAVAVRRMHDTDRSGWWIIVPIVGFVFLMLNGDAQKNRFGEDPKSNLSF
ncbi:DUF805 domain-containing protein [Psychromonas sp. Urea-02u-13]|uniref:DUF805 domain-containing protein n=1 Tax=Psychromonas sp. Urea-02u-13 TaxID=2058326 RepID=UPI000C325B59|nr:DUF805 domain-containing protein [Psychromonas sp. Urea-02u-13]PKG38282.1 DUF805 domain-containing protein [Psychromonas sp. Urea-02u-13]